MVPTVPARRAARCAERVAAAAAARVHRQGHDVLSLHVHEDNPSAREVYARAGYKVLSVESAWSNLWGPRRILMVKDLISS